MFLLLSQVPVTFLPRDRGDYAQFWDLECHPVSEPQQKTRIRFQLCGTVRTYLLVLWPRLPYLNALNSHTMLKFWVVLYTSDTDIVYFDNIFH